MSLFLNIFTSVLAPIILVAFTGYAIRRWGKLDPGPLVKISYYVFNPALGYLALAQAQVEPVLLGRLALLTALVTVAMVALGYLAGRQLRLPPVTGSAFVLAVAFTNTGNFGLPVSEFMFGADGLAMAVICFMAGNLALNSIGVYVAARGRVGVREALGQVLRNPGIWAVLLGLIANRTGWSLPLPLERAVDLLSRPTVPVMLLVLGMQLAAMPMDRSHWGLVGLASFMRLIISPLLAFLLASPLGLTGLPWKVGILQAAVPTAVLASVVASQYDTEPNFVSGAILVSSLICLVTITALLTLMG